MVITTVITFNYKLWVIKLIYYSYITWSFCQIRLFVGGTLLSQNNSEVVVGKYNNIKVNDSEQDAM